MTPSASSDPDYPLSSDEAQPSVAGPQHSGLSQSAGHRTHTHPMTESQESPARVQSASCQPDSATCSASPSPVTPSPVGDSQLPWEAVQSQSGRCTDGLVLCLDDGTAYKDGDTLRAFQAISEVS